MCHWSVSPFLTQIRIHRLQFPTHFPLRRVSGCSTSPLSPQACIRVLYQLMSEYVSVPWEALSHLSGSVIYGGRVTDKWDQRTLSAILGKFFNEGVLQNSTKSFSTIEVGVWGWQEMSAQIGRL